jgi:hypothetical protein
MVDVKHNKCEACNETRPSYGKEGGPPTHCVKCKTDNMVSKMCEACNQKIRINGGIAVDVFRDKFPGALP